MDKCFYNKKMVGKKVSFFYDGDEHTGVVIDATEEKFTVQTFNTKEKLTVDIYNIRPCD